MESGIGSVRGGEWWLYALPAVLLKTPRAHGIDKFGCALGVVCICAAVMVWWWRRSRPGGCAWAGGRRSNHGIPGPAGLPVLGSLVDMTVGLAHRNLAELARIHGAGKLMAFSLGSTPAVITSDPDVARELLGSPHMADRPLKESARELLFGRAMGFAPSGEYWRTLRRISASHLFAPRRIAAHEPGRQADSLAMLSALRAESAASDGGAVGLRRHLQEAALRNVMGSVFGRRGLGDAAEVREMVAEGFRLLGAFNWADHLPWLRPLDPLRIHRRCARLVPRVRRFVENIIREHRAEPAGGAEDSDFVDVLLALQGDDTLTDDDMVAVLWEMVFRGTDTTALLAEWTMAEMVLNPEAQRKVQRELERVVGRERSVRDEDLGKLPYLEAVVKEALRLHPPGPLLSWARLATQDVHLAAAGGMCVPAGTTAMVNMWSITHDPRIWESPQEFRPERFVAENVDVRGSDLRLAPFGAGRRVCPGKALGLATVHLWVAKLLHHFVWLPSPNHPVDLSELLNLSCEMAHPLRAIPRARLPF